MGAAAQQRGDAVIGRQAYADVRARFEIEEMVRVVEIAESCNEFVRQALDFIVEPKGLRTPSIEAAKSRRGWAKRLAAVTEAHCRWVDVDHCCAAAYHAASVKRAQAVYALFTFALGSWTIPDRIAAPRAAIGR